ncbi:MAG: adenylyltransferase/cytidyltransferase family protein [Bacteroides sp.]|nr:adenylyltransferase/cytidyltransferase family protein [Bacteroides sp.]MCM1379909.1 adenylyltransferase/cytidyltransferase family protein [Bacteroides sp.]MCM1446237.1 adenylyltransferase/cytidyltransferase family protein [Prevotella sp.]
MKRVITYGTYDLLHHGHIRLLERAKALGDYLIVGVTSDDFDRSRGKINVAESLMQRIEAVRRTGLADEIIVEEYEGQKIDDIKRLGVDIFTVGSDWKGKFDYLSDYCEVVYLDRTDGVSSSELRAKEREIRIGIIGNNRIVEKYVAESRYVNGLTMGLHLEAGKEDEFFSQVDAVYVVSHPSRHYDDVKTSLLRGKHVLCESPIAPTPAQVNELYDLAGQKGLTLADGIKTAYSTAYSRLIGMAKSGKIGKIVSVDSTCTSLKTLEYSDSKVIAEEWNSLSAWGPTALLPVIDLLGSDWLSAEVVSRMANDELQFDDFSKISLIYPGAVSTSKFGKGVKSEGELVVSGTKGYFYVPAPWWKTDYFEIRYENPADNRRYFYQLDGEGIRNELVAFARMVNGSKFNPIDRATSAAIAALIGNDTEIAGKVKKNINFH